jgi:hypothetical protein
MKTTTLDHIEIAIRFVRACGPVTAAEIEGELLTQCQTATGANALTLADKAIAHGLAAGWLECYDEESFCIA